LALSCGRCFIAFGWSNNGNAAISLPDFQRLGGAIQQQFSRFFCRRFVVGA
jgi:hypothetical protein